MDHHHRRPIRSGNSRKSQRFDSSREATRADRGGWVSQEYLSRSPGRSSLMTTFGGGRFRSRRKLLIMGEILYRRPESLDILPERAQADLAPWAEQTSDYAGRAAVDPGGKVVIEWRGADPTSAILLRHEPVVLFLGQSGAPESRSLPETRPTPRRAPGSPTPVRGIPRWVPVGLALGAFDCSFGC
jgi:hypothetical protein